MDTVGNLSGKGGDMRKMILIAAVAIIGLMILFPPKYIAHHNPLNGESMSQSA